MNDIKKYFRVKRSDCYFPFSMSYLDEFTNGDIKRIMGFSDDEEIEEITLDEYRLGSFHEIDDNWADLLCSIALPKPRVHRHRTPDECKKNRVAKRRKKNKNNKTHRK